MNTYNPFNKLNKPEEVHFLTQAGVDQAAVPLMEQMKRLFSLRELAPVLVKPFHHFKLRLLKFLNLVLHKMQPHPFGGIFH